MGTVKYSDMAEAISKIDRLNFGNLEKLESLKIGELGNVSSYYIPFEYVNAKAKIVLVGITPGTTQLANALRSVQNSVENGLSQDEVLINAKKEGAFSGPMRKTLVSMLDLAGLNKKLGIETCMSLFGKDAHLVQTTSLLRHPIFVNGKAYTGHSPKMLRNPLMLQMLKDYFIADEVSQLTDAIYIPLGKSVTTVMEQLVKDGVLKESQVLLGLPHPSGSNGEPIAYFLGRKKKEDLVQVNASEADIVKASILDKIEKLKF